MGVCVCSVAQSYLTLCDPMDSSGTGSSVHVIFQVRILERVTISYSRGSSQPRDRTPLSCVSCIGRWILCHCATWEARNCLFFSSSRIQRSKISFMGLKSKCWHSWGFWRENIFSCLFYLLVAVSIPWFVAPSYEQSILPQSLLLSSHYLFLLFRVKSVCFLLVMTIVITFRAHWDNPR